MADAAKATADAAKATEAGNRQRAFKDGVEHLGSDKASVRQGGAHALFHLALKDEELRVSIAGFLCAHIRETTGAKDYQAQHKDKPSTEMQSLLRLLFTTETVDEGRLERFWKGITPDLEGGYFLGVELSNARFQRAKLDSAQFQGHRLGKPNSKGHRFGEPNSKGHRFGKPNSKGHRFGEPNSKGRRLGRPNSKGRRLGRSNSKGHRLGRPNSKGQTLSEAQFQGAKLERAQFQGANLERAQFQGADLERAQFQGARLSGSEFQGASLYMAGFQQAQFGQEPEHEGNPAPGHTAAKFDDLVEAIESQRISWRFFWTHCPHIV